MIVDRRLKYLLLLVLVSIGISPAILLEERGVDYLSYMSHAYTLGVDGDLDYSNELVVLRDYCMNPIIERPCNPIGAAVFTAPWVALGAIADRAFGHPVIENRRLFRGSWSYFGLVFASSFWVFMGLVAYLSAVRKVFGKIPQGTLIAAILGSSLVVYTVIQPVNAHAIEFFTIALAFWGCSVAVVAPTSSRRHWGEVVAGIGIGLTIVVRPADLNILLLPVLLVLTWIVLQARREGGGVPIPVRATIFSTGRIWAYALVTFSPMMLYSYDAYGALFPGPGHLYGKHMLTTVPKVIQEGEVVASANYFFDKIPDIWKIVFSSEFGTAYTAPMMTFGSLFLLLGWAFLGWRKERFLLAVSVFLCVGLPIAIVLHWQTVASSYGFRYLLVTIPVGVLGVALFWSWWQSAVAEGASRRRLLTYKGLWLGFWALIVVSLVSQFFIGVTSELAFQVGENVFGKFTRWGGKGYMLAVAHEATSLGGWIDMVAHRLPGFIAFGIANAVHLDVEAIGRVLGIPADVLASGMRRYANLPAAIWVQLCLVLAFWVGGLYWLLNSARFRST